MSWTEKRIKEYGEGQKPTYLEKMALEHGNPINCVLHIIALALLIYGLWTHQWTWIIAAAVAGILGHCYCRMKK